MVCVKLVRKAVQKVKRVNVCLVEVAFPSYEEVNYWRLPETVS